MQLPLQPLVGYLADGPAVQSILDESFRPVPGIDWYAIEVIQVLRIPDSSVCQANPIDISVLLEQQKLNWRRQRSGTTVEPSGLDFDHFKCATHNNRLASVDLLLQLAPVQVGFTPPLWCKIMNIAILKRKMESMILTPCG